MSRFENDLFGANVFEWPITKIIQIISSWQACYENDCLGQPTSPKYLLFKNSTM